MGKKENSVLDWGKTRDSRVKIRNNWYYARFSLNRVRVEQCLWISIEEKGGLDKAIQKASEIEKYIRDKKDFKDLFVSVQTERKKSVLIGELFPEFMEYRKQGDPRFKIKPWRENTASHYQLFWDLYFEPFFGNKLPNEIENLWPDYIEFAQKKSERKKNLVMFNHYKYFSSFCTYLLDQEKLSKRPKIWNPDADTEDDDGCGIVYPDDTIKKMIEKADGSFKLYVSMGALMGMRSREITALKKDRIFIGSDIIKLKAIDVKTGSKTKKGRTIPIPSFVKDLLLKQISDTKESDFLFPNFRYREGDRPMDRGGFKKLWDELRCDVGFPTGRFHDLRHTYATKALSNPLINPALVCKALGMSMATAEKVYLHFRDDHFRLITANFSYSDFGLSGTNLGLEYHGDNNETV